MMPYSRTIHLADTDAAGVVYFASVLSICHEAYEASLMDVGINLKTFVSNPEVAIPIVSASVDLFRPMFCGDRILITLTPALLRDTEFEIAYSISGVSSPDVQLARAKTRHVCINPTNRTRSHLSEEIRRWLGV